jgi:hypothetical protein
MLRFVTDNDELAAVLAHEIAHNALGHVKAQSKNAIDGPFGAVCIRSGAASRTSRGGYAAGSPSATRACAGSRAARTPISSTCIISGTRHAVGRPIAEVTNLWKHMAQHNPANVRYVGTHPTPKARLVRLERTERDMAQRIARGELPRPQVPTGGFSTRQALATYQLSAGDWYRTPSVQRCRGAGRR